MLAYGQFVQERLMSSNAFDHRTWLDIPRLSSGVCLPKYLDPQSCDSPVQCSHIMHGAKHLSTPLSACSKASAYFLAISRIIDRNNRVWVWIMWERLELSTTTAIIGSPMRSEQVSCRSSQFGRAQYLLPLTRNLDAQLGGNGA
jgi:hypothetical protein